MPLTRLDDPLLIVAVVLLAGTTLGALARACRLPAVTGQIVAGIVLGPGVLHLFEASVLGGLQPLSHFALTLIGATVGTHLNIARLRNAGRRLLMLLAAEAVVIPAAVMTTLGLLSDAPPSVVVLLGPLALATAPATVVAVVREARARGVFVKTLIAAVAINNLTCILLFELARSVAALGLRQSLTLSALTDSEVLLALLTPIADVGSALVLGAAIALVTHLVTERVAHRDGLTTFSLISLLLTCGLASSLSLSPLLAAMALGVVQTNLDPARERLIGSVFANFEAAILCVFFTLAGSHVRLDQAGQALGIALLFFAARALGKVAAASAAMHMAGATRAVRNNLGLALLPQADVAIGLVILIENDPIFAPLASLFVAIVLTSVPLNEILGPIATRVALARAGETGGDRPRLIDFLQEENILIDLTAASMQDAIERLTDFLIRSHHLRGVDRDALVKSVLEREAQVSTRVGGGLAVPHGELPEGLPMVGVMGISRQGLPFETPDGRPVHCIVLLATPRGQRDRHLAVLAALARRIGTDPSVQQEIYSARSAAHVYEVLHRDQAELNYFLDGHDA